MRRRRTRPISAITPAGHRCGGSSSSPTASARIRGCRDRAAAAAEPAGRRLSDAGEGNAYRTACRSSARAPTCRAKARASTRHHPQGHRRGLLNTIRPALKFLREAKSTYDGFLVIGDFIGVGRAGSPAPRRGLSRRLSYGLRAAVQLHREADRQAHLRHGVLPQPALANQLAAIGIDARASGNVMMDTIPRPTTTPNAGGCGSRAAAAARQPRGDGRQFRIADRGAGAAARRDEARRLRGGGRRHQPRGNGEAANLFFHGPAGRSGATWAG